MADDNFEFKKWGSNGIRVYTGTMYYPLDPRPDDVYVEDIAHALSNMCRFAGHTKDFYSVAQHSWLVSYLVPDYMALTGLFHDASEAYCVDLPRPIKHSGALDAYKAIEELNEVAISKALGIFFPFPKEIKEADIRALVTEQRDLFRVERDKEWILANKPLHYHIRPWGPKKAKRMFLRRYRELMGTPSRWDRVLSFLNKIREVICHENL